jgi:hypothetical protein
MMSEALRKAAEAVVARWDSPDWKDGTHTADYINALRKALAEPEQSWGASRTNQAAEDAKNQLLREQLDAMPMGKGPDHTHYEKVTISMASLIEIQKMISDRDAVLRQALEALEYCEPALTDDYCITRVYAKETMKRIKKVLEPWAKK